MSAEPTDHEPVAVPRVIVAGPRSRWRSAVIAALSADCESWGVGTGDELVTQIVARAVDLIVLDGKLLIGDGRWLSAVLRLRAEKTQVLLHLRDDQETDGLLHLTFHGVCSGNDTAGLVRQAATLLGLDGRLSPGTPSGRYVSYALNFLTDHYSEHLDVAIVATRMSLSPGYLARIFRNEMRIGMREFVLRMRIEAAKLILAETDATLGAVAQRSGFFDAAHFSRVFRRYEGCTPGQYRRTAVTYARHQ